MIRLSELAFSYVAVATGFAIAGVLLHVWTVARPTDGGISPSLVLLSLVVGGLAWLLVTVGLKWHEAATNPPLPPERDVERQPPLP